MKKAVFQWLNIKIVIFKLSKFKPNNISWFWDMFILRTQSHSKTNEIWIFLLIFHAFYVHKSNFMHRPCPVHAHFMHVYGH